MLNSQHMHLDPLRFASDKGSSRFPELKQEKQLALHDKTVSDVVEANMKQYELLVHDQLAIEVSGCMLLALTNKSHSPHYIGQDGMRQQESAAMLMMLLRQRTGSSCTSRAQMPPIVDRLLRAQACARIQASLRQEWADLSKHDHSHAKDERSNKAVEELLDEDGVFRIPGMSLCACVCRFGSLIHCSND